MVAFGVALVLFSLGAPSAAADRNCPALASNAGEQSPFGFDPQLIEVQFCGGRLIGTAALQQFQTNYAVTFDHVTPVGGQTNVVYVFRLQSGTPPDKVRQVAQDADVAAASVESLGQAALPSAGPSSSPNGLPSTTTLGGGESTSSGSGVTDFSGLGWVLVVALALVVAASLFGRRRRT